MESPRSRFAPVAANYTKSAFHSDRDLLQEVIELAWPEPGELVLDVATGTGHAALAVAPHAGQVIGLDLTPEMLAEAARLARSRSVANVAWVLGDAQELPFPDARFDLYTVRAAPHHFPDLDAALAEARRVLRRGGRACFIDCAPPAAARDHLHSIEVARDPSHVLSLTAAEWLNRIEAAGLRVDYSRTRELDWDFQTWMETMAVPGPLAGELAATLEAATGPARTELHPERRDGRLFHGYWHALIRAVKD